MFSVKENACVGFDSNWKVTRVYTESESQTKECGMREIWTSTSTTNEIETQTDEPADEPVQQFSEVDEKKLASFLTNIYPSVKKELNEAENSNAFYGSYSFEESDQTPDAKLLQIIDVAGATSQHNPDALRVSALSWNCTGNSLAVSFNCIHKSWCHHSGQVFLYTYESRHDKLPALPNKKLKVSSCITVLRFHTAVSYIIACGSHSGEIIIWNVQQDDGDGIIAKVSAHEDPLTDMMWMHDLNAQKSILLASSSLDGCLNLWNFSLMSSALVIKKKYKIKSPVLSRVGPKKSIPKNFSNKIVRGILSFDFSLYIPDLFMVGVEGGLVVQCSTSGTNSLKGSTLEVPIEDPVYKYYEPHEGEIQTVRCSPNRKDMFLTSASDGEIRIYVIDQEVPARVIFLEKELQHVSWIPYQEKLIVGCGESGILEIFQLIKNRKIDNITSEKVTPTTLLQLEVNKYRCNTVAVGNDRGELQLWSLPWSLFALQK